MSNVTSNIFYEIAGNYTGNNYPNNNQKKTGEKKEKDFKIIRFTIPRGEVFKAWDSNGLADPKVLVYLLKEKKDGGESKKLLFKTNVCKKTLLPNFQFSEMYKVPSQANYIIVELWDDDLVMDDFIGSCKTRLNFNDTPESQNLVLFDKEKCAQGNVMMMMQKVDKNGHNLLNVKN
ncbi:hypothetical protein ACTFIZ_011852 [Dictyostelium cf. discoideum]